MRLSPARKTVDHKDNSARYVRTLQDPTSQSTDADCLHERNITHRKTNEKHEAIQCYLRIVCSFLFCIPEASYSFLVFPQRFS